MRILVAVTALTLSLFSFQTVVIAVEQINPMWCYTHPEHAIGYVSISGDGSLIAGAMDEGGVILLNKNGEVVWEKDLGDPISGVAISDDGEIIAAISVPETNKFVIYLLSKDGSVFRKIEHKIDPEKYPEDIEISYWLSPDIMQVNDKYILVNTWDPPLFWIFSVEDGSLVETGVGFPWDVFSMWERNKPLCDSKTLEVYKKYGFTKKSFCPGSYFNVNERLRTIAIVSNTAVIGDWSGYVYVFNYQTGELLYEYEIGNRVFSVDMSSNGQYFVATTTYESGNPPKTCLFDLNNPNPDKASTTISSSTTKDSEFKLLWENTEHIVELSHLFSYENYVVGVGYRGLHIFDKNSGIQLNQIELNCLQKLTADINGDYLAIGCDKVIYAISLENKGEVLWSQVLSDIINSVSTNGEKIVAGCADGRVHVLSRDGGKSFSKFLGKDPVVDVEIADASSYVAIGTINGRIYLMDINKGEIVWQYELEYPIGDLTVSPAGDVIVVGSIDDNVYFFENGNLAWKAYVGGDVCKVLYSPKYGTVFAGTCEDRKDNSVTTINSKGLVVSQITASDYIQSLTLNEEETLAAAGSRGHIYIFSGEGSFLTTYKTGDYTSMVFSLTFLDTGDLVASMYPSKTFLLDIPENIGLPGDSQDSKTSSGYVVPSNNQEVGFYTNQMTDQMPFNIEYILLFFFVLVPGLMIYYRRNRKTKSTPPVVKAHPTENLQKEYEILEYLGGGGFADVYKAKANDKVVAIKVPRELRPEFEETFLNEVEKWRKLDHRNIVKLIKPRLNPPHLVLEYVDGGTLKDKLKKGKLSVTEACKIAYDVARALEYAHSKLIIHTDINPKNILLTSFGEAKLTDFGLAKIVTSSSGIRGLTLEYSAPEQLKGKADEKTDVYQLGLLLYEMLTGFNPFSSGDIQEVERRIMESTPDPPSKFVDGVEELDDLIMRCLSKNPDERPSIREFRERIYEFMKKSYGVSLHLTRDFRSYAKMCVELAFYSAKEGDLARCLAELKAAREKVGDREIREELDKAIEMVEYMIRENVHSEEFLRMLEVLVRRI